MEIIGHSDGRRLLNDNLNTRCFSCDIVPLPGWALFSPSRFQLCTKCCDERAVWARKLVEDLNAADPARSVQHPHLTPYILVLKPADGLEDVVNPSAADPIAWEGRRVLFAFQLNDPRQTTRRTDGKCRWRVLSQVEARQACPALYLAVCRIAGSTPVQLPIAAPPAPPSAEQILQAKRGSWRRRIEQAMKSGWGVKPSQVEDVISVIEEIVTEVRRE